MKNIALFASGKGTNAGAIVAYFKNHKQVQVSLIVTNNPKAGVLKLAAQERIISAIVTDDALNSEATMLSLLKAQNIDLIVLAGFMKHIPDFIVHNYSGRIINIHPALLPKFGGRGMYGSKVHEAVIASGEKVSGITIHYVNEVYDDGEHILQKSIDLLPDETPQTLAERVLELEHQWYPRVIEQLLR